MLPLGLLAALLVPASSAQGAVDGFLWTAEVRSTANKEETPPRNFTTFGMGAISNGALFFGTAFGQQSGRDDLDLLPIATYSFTGENSTTVTLACKPGEASFGWNVRGRARVEGSLEDGFARTIFFEGRGTGVTRAGAYLEATGDISYAADKDSPAVGTETNPVGSVALAASDRSADRSGDLTVGPVSLNLEGFNADVPFAGTAVGSAQNSRPAQGPGAPRRKVFSAQLKSYAKMEFEAESEGFGEVVQRIRELQITHTGTIDGYDCLTADGQVLSTATILFDERFAEVRFRTRDVASGNLFEDRLVILKAPNAQREIRATDGRERDRGWDTPQTEWKPVPRRARFRTAAVGPSTEPGASRDQPARYAPHSAQVPPAQQLGVRRGSRASYAVVAKGSRLRALRRLDFRITKADPDSGQVGIAESATMQGARKPRRQSITVDAFTGEGDLKGLIVPSGLNEGDPVYGTGEVTRVSGNRVSVVLREGRTRLSATYDRRSGWLIGLSERGAGNASLKLTRLPAP